MKLILASTSPRRRELLQRLNIAFEIVEPGFIEVETGLAPKKETLYLAEKKALSVAPDHPNTLILASDTLVVLDEKKLGKPQNSDDACHMLQSLANKKHEVYTAVVLLNTQDHSLKKHVEIASVTFRQLSDQEITDYVATGEPLDKAGAYAVQGGAKKFVTKVDGDLDAVIGLPLEPIRRWLKVNK